MNKALHIRTPLIHSLPLSLKTRRNIYVKLETVQPSLSYKIRGIGHLCQHLKQQGTTHFVASSGGNAGLATAYAGRRLDIPTTVFLPTTTPKMMEARIRLEGAEVIFAGDNLDAVHEKAIAFAEKPHHAYIHPFDNPLIWQGHSSLMQEIAEDGLTPDLIIVAVGGGGLMNGLIHGIRTLGWQDIPFITTETIGSSSLNLCIQNKSWDSLPAITTIATSLGARKVSKQSYEYTKTYPMTPWVVDDATSVKACLNFLEDHKILVEPACGTAFSYLYEKADTIDPSYQNILVIGCGGANVSLEKLLEWKTTYNI